MTCIPFLNKFKKTIQFNNKPLLMTTQAIEMIVIPVPLAYFRFALISIFTLRNNGQCQAKRKTNHVGKFRAVA